MIYFDNPVWRRMPWCEGANAQPEPASPNDLHNAVVDLEEATDLVRTVADAVLYHGADGAILAAAVIRLSDMVNIIGPTLRASLDVAPEGEQDARG